MLEGHLSWAFGIKERVGGGVGPKPHVHLLFIPPPFFTILPGGWRALRVSRPPEEGTVTEPPLWRQPAEAGQQPTLRAGASREVQGPLCMRPGKGPHEGVGGRASAGLSRRHYGLEVWIMYLCEVFHSLI